MSDIERIDLVLEHAKLIRQRVDFPFDCVSLIHLALERYAERIVGAPREKGAPR